MIRLPALIGIRLHPKTSDSATVVLRFRNSSMVELSFSSLAFSPLNFTHFIFFLFIVLNFSFHQHSAVRAHSQFPWWYCLCSSLSELCEHFLRLSSVNTLHAVTKRNRGFCTV